MNDFIELTDKNNAPVFIKKKQIKAVYFDKEEKLTAIDYNVARTMYVKEHVYDIIVKLKHSKEGG